MAGQKTFLLGVGCQKGGTTWLHQYLDGHENTDMGFVKEYHIFDALYIPGSVTYRKNAARDVLQGRATHAKKHLRKQRRRLRFYDDTALYFQYFARLAAKSPHTLLVGDITPSYAGLPIAALREIRTGLLAQGFRIRVVFFIRDPFERIWSMARMKLNNSHKHRGMSEVEVILAHYDTQYTQIRSRYEQTLPRLEQVFAPEELYVEFYERQFDLHRIAALMDFLDLPYREPDLETRIHGSDKTMLIPEDITVQVVEEYRQTYEFIAGKFGKTLVEGLWSSTRFL